MQNPNMRVTCPNCHNLLPSSAINLEWLIAKCDDCGRLFDCSRQQSEQLSDPSPVPPPAAPLTRQRQRTPVPLPDGMHLEVSVERETLLPSNYRSESPNVTGNLKLERRWRTTRTSTWFRTAFVLFWCGALVMLFEDVLRGGSGSLLVALIFSGVAVSLLHQVLAEIFNITTITANAQTLTIHHGPIPVGGNQQIAVAGIEQLYCKEVETTRRDEDGVDTFYSYSVIARFADGREFPLVDGLPRPEQALFIEQQLEAHLRIIDVHVEGEFSDQ